MPTPTGPVLKPVMSTSSFSRDAAASGALALPESTALTVWKYARDTRAYFSPVTVEGRASVLLLLPSAGCAARAYAFRIGGRSHNCGQGGGPDRARAVSS